MRRYLQTLTAACLLAGPSIAAAAMTETSQFCNVMTFAQISVPGEDPLFVSQDRRSQELDPYQDISSSALDDGTNQAASHAILDVAFTETRIATSGEFQSAAHIENDGFAEALGTSRYTIDFTLDQPAVCSLGGVAEARDNGHGTVLFRRTDSEILVYQEVNLGRVAVDHLLNLDPGSYTLDVSIGGYGQSFPQIGSVPASGHFDIAFQVLSPTSAPLPGASAVLTAYPNPARDQVVVSWQRELPAGSPISILDASGRVVREIAVGGSDLVWDLRDDRGVAVPSGIYFARAAAGPPVRVTVLR